jgi:hypothetical protein
VRTFYGMDLRIWEVLAGLTRYDIKNQDLA